MLMEGVRHNFIGLVSYLISCKADVNRANRWGLTALQIAAQRNHIRCARLLIEEGNAKMGFPSHGLNALMLASEEGNLEMVRFLVREKNFSVHLQTLVERTSALVMAASNGHVGVMQELLEAEASVNIGDRNGLTPLMAAATGNHFEAVKCLVEDWGAQVDQGDAFERTALAWACGQPKAGSRDHMRTATYDPNENEKVVRFLILEAKANPNSVDRTGLTPIMSAVSHENTRLVRLLAPFCHVSVDLRSKKDNFTALSLACALGKREMVSALVLEAKANYRERNDGRITPRQIAMMNAHAGIVRDLGAVFQKDVKAVINRDLKSIHMLYPSILKALMNEICCQ
mmetsp:Transcript_7530/g.10623  ORF Transcript_7530/g.10623 Transcript_7530/m.10623 type:complete len:343 (+) Transcript_7530:2-1030(+)